LDRVLRDLAGAHEARTGTRVYCAVTDLPEHLPMIVRTTVCRFIRESLDLASEQACANDHRVSVWWDGTSLMVEIKDEGAWPPAAKEPERPVRLGLVGPWDLDSVRHNKKD
jgi:hypothetical protein